MVCPNPTGEQTAGVADTRPAAVLAGGGDDGSATAALLGVPADVAVDGNVHVADTDNHRVRKLTPPQEAGVASGDRDRDSDDELPRHSGRGRF